MIGSEGVAPSTPPEEIAASRKITGSAEGHIPDFDNGSPKSEIRWEQRLQQPMLGGYEHNSGGCCTIGKFHCNR